MPTNNPKISGYLPKRIYDRFKEYQKEQNLTMSQAVIVILSEYFGIEGELTDIVSTSPIGGVTLSAFQQLQERLSKVELEVELLKSTSNNKVEQKETTEVEQVVEQQGTTEVEQVVEQKRTTEVEQVVEQKGITEVEQVVEQKGITEVEQVVEQWGTRQITLNAEQLSKRLGITTQTLGIWRRKKSTQEFGRCTNQNDIDGITWTFTKDKREYVYCPSDGINSDLLSKLLKWVEEEKIKKIDK